VPEPGNEYSSMLLHQRRVAAVACVANVVQGEVTLETWEVFKSFQTPSLSQLLHKEGSAHISLPHASWLSDWIYVFRITWPRRLDFSFSDSTPFSPWFGETWNWTHYPSNHHRYIRTFLSWSVFSFSSPRCTAYFPSDNIREDQG